MWWWIIPSGGFGTVVYLLVGDLAEGAPLWLRLAWGLCAGCACLLIGPPWR